MGEPFLQRIPNDHADPVRPQRARGGRGIGSGRLVVSCKAQQGGQGRGCAAEDGAVRWERQRVCGRGRCGG
eukprot:7380436-Prymnesium_polylepis.1